MKDFFPGSPSSSWLTHPEEAPPKTLVTVKVVGRDSGRTNSRSRRRRLSSLASSQYLGAHHGADSEPKSRKGNNITARQLLAVLEARMRRPSTPKHRPSGGRGSIVAEDVSRLLFRPISSEPEETAISGSCTEPSSKKTTIAARSILTRGDPQSRSIGERTGTVQAKTAYDVAKRNARSPRTAVRQDRCPYRESRVQAGKGAPVFCCSSTAVHEFTKSLTEQ